MKLKKNQQMLSVEKVNDGNFVTVFKTTFNF
jgi:hypothetical protein